MSQLIPALPGLVAIGLGTGLLALFGRDPKANDANQHDISDYVPDPMPPKSSRRVTVRVTRPAHRKAPTLPIEWDATDDILPPAPPGTNAGGSPIHTALVAERVVAEQLRKWGATPAERAHRILRELGDKAQMEATR